MKITVKVGVLFAFIWMMVLAIGCNLMIFPLINMATGKGLQAFVIPGSYLQVFSAVMISLGGMRTIEKLKDKD